MASTMATRILISVGLLLGAFVFIESYSHGEAVPIRQPLDRFPRTIGEFESRESTILSEAVLDVLQPTDYVVRRYEGPRGADLSLYIGYWESQRKGAQIHSPKHCLPGGGWEPLEAQIVPIRVDDSREPIRVNRYILQKEAHQLLVAYWYQTRGEAVATELDAKIHMVKNSILHNRSDGAIVRVMSPVDGSIDAAWDRVVDYVKAMYPKLDAFLPA